ncbi:MAG: phospho-sugar mutase [Acidobacteriota bacterium]|nr:phospho-sugar mutase [Acidobacteriota bacterium]MDH3522551.1 phospho-sugar mutase [Acidobacteriota bacterium]
MPESLDLETVASRLAATYGPQGAQAAHNLRRWAGGEVPLVDVDVLSLHFREDLLGLLFDAFWQVLPFGTGGRRGPVGYGPNRINATTVAMTAQGHCDYLLANFERPEGLAVIVANDVRVFNDVAGVYGFLAGRPRPHPLLGASSRSFGRLACEIYAGNGITAFFQQPERADAVLTTPELSFLIRQLDAQGGINLSASHNPPDDNGVKVYDEQGSQPVAPADQVLVDAMSRVTEVRRTSFAEALDRGLVRPIPAELHRRYLDTYRQLYADVHRPNAHPVVYTPLCGAGLTTVGEVLVELGFPMLTPPDEGPDGGFTVIPFKAPNPEVPQSTQPARAFADSVSSTIVLSSDPDADRVGVEVKLADGTWYHFDGNQIAAVLGYFLMLDPRGPRRRGLVLETLVTTKILGRIVEQAGGSAVVDDLLVGFKYIADVLKRLESGAGYRGLPFSPADLVLAAEESHGVLVAPGIRDKDSTPACMYLAALHQMQQSEGRNLLDYYVGILEELGGFDSVNRSIMMSGADGVGKRDAIMASLRAAPPATIGGQEVARFVDCWDESGPFGRFVSETERLPRNVVQFIADSLVVTVRPSGTEPKLKLYCEVLPTAAAAGLRGRELLAAVRERADGTARRVYNELLERIGLAVGEAALLLPDIVDLDRKLVFQNEIVPQLEKAVDGERFADLASLLEWLRESARALTPGSDPLPALKGPVAFLCSGWAEALAPRARFHELRDWAQSRS